jgi:hypothetical protein
VIDDCVYSQIGARKTTALGTSVRRSGNSDRKRSSILQDGGFTDLSRCRRIYAGLNRKAAEYPGALPFIRPHYAAAAREHTTWRGETFKIALVPWRLAPIAAPK